MTNNPQYEDFLRSKKRYTIARGFEVDPARLNPMLKPFQRDIVQWALLLGKSAIFAAVGLGKTFMQLDWSHRVASQFGGGVLILAPLGVAHQTTEEGKKFGYHIPYVQDQDEYDRCGSLVAITNYDRVDNFLPHKFIGVVLDESSILKNYSGSTKNKIIDMFKDLPYKLCCSATPAPNDHVELGNHAEFLDIMSSQSMLATYFINDRSKTGVYRLKNHARDAFWEWLTSWAVCIRKPSDLGEGYSDEGYILPELRYVDHHIGFNDMTIQEAWAEGKLLPDTAPSSSELGRVKRKTIQERVDVTKSIVESYGNKQSIIIWCLLNDEQDALEKALPHAISVRGSDKPQEKIRKLREFKDGNCPIISKTSIVGAGMNWQHAPITIFVSSNYSFESQHQAIGRNYRYGQTENVDVHIIYSEAEGNVFTALAQKQEQFNAMQEEMTTAMRRYGLFRSSKTAPIYNPLGDQEMIIPSWLTSHIEFAE